MRNTAALTCTAVAVAGVIAGCTGSGAEATPTAPSATTAPTRSTKSNPPAVAPPTTIASTPATTVPPTTALATTVPPTTQPDTTVAATNPSGVPAAVTGEPILADIPGKLIDYVPQVAANLNIDVPGQYYEILPKVYVFIPTEDSTAHPNLRKPKAEHVPLIESYVRAKASLWSVYTTNPIPPNGSDELKSAFTKSGYVQYDEIIRDAVGRGIHTVIRGGDINVPRVSSADGESSTVLDCGWYDQYDVGPDGTVSDDRNRRNSASAQIVKVGTDWIVDVLSEDPKGCT